MEIIGTLYKPYQVRNNMARGRDVSAWVNACRMSNRSYFFVEGVSDECFWKKYINRDVINIQQVNGWENVVDCVRKFNDESLHNYCIGIVDRDFEHIYPHKAITENNIFMTDYHDLEMMMYQSSALDSVLKAIDRKNKINWSYIEVLNHVFGITDKIGSLKLSSQKESLGLIFKKENRDHEFELPKYEKFITNSGDYESDDKLIKYIYDYSKSNKRTPEPLPAVDRIITIFNESREMLHPSSHLSNGHDVSYVMPIVLERKFKLKDKHVTIDTIVIALYAAYNMDLLKQTQLYQAINKWEIQQNKNILLK